MVDHGNNEYTVGCNLVEWIRALHVRAYLVLWALVLKLLGDYRQIYHCLLASVFSTGQIIPVSQAC